MKIYSFSILLLVASMMGATLLLPNFDLKVTSLNLSGDISHKGTRPLGSWSGGWPASSGYHNYGFFAIDATGIPNGGAVTVHFQAQSVPNVFTVLDNCGMGTTSSSGWQGTASYPGPWGMSIANASSGDVTLLKQNGCNSYKLQVETSTSSSINDVWTATN